MRPPYGGPPVWGGPDALRRWAGAPAETETDGLRVGDAERDAVATVLHEHFGLGRLTPEELDERLDAALTAKTRGDLRAVTRDLPGPSGLPGGAVASPARPRRGPFPPLLLLLLVGGSLALAAEVPVFFMVLFVICLMAFRHRRRHGHGQGHGHGMCRPGHHH